ncbi:unnamed protein product, partial [Rotaria magnacalcarata]
MGVSRSHAIHALTETNNNVEAAIDWALSNPENASTLHSLIEALPKPSLF